MCEVKGQNPDTEPFGSTLKRRVIKNKGNKVNREIFLTAELSISAKISAKISAEISADLFFFVSTLSR